MSYGLNFGGLGAGLTAGLEGLLLVGSELLARPPALLTPALLTPELRGVVVSMSSPGSRGGGQVGIG